MIKAWILYFFPGLLCVFFSVPAFLAKLASNQRSDRRHGKAEKNHTLELLLRLGKLSAHQYKDFSQVLEDYEASGANALTEANARRTESPLASSKPFKQLLGRTLSHVEITVASPSLKRNSRNLSPGHVGSPLKRSRREEDVEADEDEAYLTQASLKWKGKERDLFSRGRSSKLEQSGFPTKPLISNGLKAFVEIPVSPRRKNRASVAEAGTSQVSDGLTDHGGSCPPSSSSSSKRRTCHTIRTTTSSTVYGSSIDDGDDETSSESDSSLYYEFDEESRASRPRLSHRNTASSSIELTPVLSPNVHRIAKKFFRNTFEVIGPDLSNKDPLEHEHLTEYTSHPGIPGTMKWGKKLAVEEDKVFYKTITMDGELYKVGDVVMVEPGEDDRKGRQGNYKSQPSQSSNGNANRFWFIQICYFFEDADDGSKQFHGRWLEHGSKTFLQETAHSRELFLTNACADAPATSIYRKCDIKFLGLAEREPEDDTSYEGDSYFCQYTWLDLDDPTFASLPQPEEVEADLLFAPDYRRCHSCVLAERMEQQRLIHHSGDCISQFGVDYHVGDFVYLRPSNLDNEQLEIAQIVGLPSPALNTVTIKVRMLCHVATRPEEAFADELLLKFSHSEETTPFNRVDGKCFVSYFPQPDAEGFKEWIKEKDHFYVLDYRKFEQCTRCMEEHETQLAMYRDFLAQEGPLSMLELFSGAGGLGTGLDQSNFVKTAAAVEFDRYAAETYQINHPDTTVYCKDVIELLRELEDGDDVKSLNGKSFPKPGDIDIIAGGPPCQAFSGANHNRKQDDVRATLPFVMLSYAEFFLPKYFLLENVVGLLRHRLLGLLQGRSIVDGIQHGVFKLITRILLALGYQVRVKVLQAANFGAPQSRERVIFLGARQGLKLPEFPMPTHAYSAKEHRLLEHADLKLCRSTRSRDPSRPHFFAPFRAVTVNDAIGDLPAFDWKNPHQIIPIVDKDIQERKVRNIRRFEATHTPGRDLPGFLSAEYAHPPMNYFQQRIREGMHNVVEEHVTPMFSPLIVERTTTVPLKPGASLKDVPAQLHPRNLQNLRTTHGRLHPNQCFRTVLTHCNPGGKNSVLLHHSQKRIITAREVSRSQGFPDRYIFLKADDLKDDIRRAYKQIGNAVPVPLALALGQSLSDALIASWNRFDRATSPDI